MKKYVILTNTICQGDICGCNGEDGKPVFFDTAEEAWKEIADDKICELDQFIKGERELDETSFSFDEWVEEVDVNEDGTRSTAPKEFDILIMQNK